MTMLLDVSIDKKVGVSLPFFYFFHVTRGDVTFIVNDAEIKVSENQGLFVSKNVCLDIKFDEINNQSANMNTIRISSDIISRFNYLNYMRSGFNIDGVNRRGLKRSESCSFDFSRYSDAERHVLHSLTASIEQANTLATKKRHENDEHVLFYEYTLLLGILMANNIAVENLLQNISSETISEMAARLIMNDYCKTWNVSTLARGLHMSESTFKKKMHKEVGSVCEFVNKLKVVESLKRLRRTTDSLTEIAADLGYCSSSYFTQVFYRHIGVLPSKIRECFNRE
ncbi:helix-turn-helix transcriptional regulator [Citrobacter freundii]